MFINYNIKFLLIVGVISLTACEDIIFVDDISEQKMQLLTPKTNDTLKTGAIAFSWLKLGDSITYRFQVAKPSFDSISEQIIDTVTTKTGITKTIAAGNYQWRVKGSNFGHATEYTTYNLVITDEE